MKSSKEKTKTSNLDVLHEIGWRRGIVYLAFLTISIALTLCGAIFLRDIAKDICVSLGCGFIPSALTGFSIDFVNASNNLKRRNEFKKSSLFRLTYGILFITKVVTEKFGALRDKEPAPLIDGFRIALENMQDSNRTNSTSLFDPDNASKLLRELSYGLDLCERDSIFILENRAQLMADGFFTEAEITTIDNVLDECRMIEVSATLDVMGGYIENLISTVYGGLPSVKRPLDAKITLKNGLIKNWAGILKQ